MVLILIILILEVFVGILYFEFKYKPKKRKAATPKWLKAPPTPIKSKKPSTPFTIRESDKNKGASLSEIAQFIIELLKK